MKLKLRSAKELNVNLADEIKIGDITTFNVNGNMINVEVVSLNVDGSLKLMSCNLKYVWRNISRTHWLKQVEFMKQFE